LRRVEPANSTQADEPTTQARVAVEHDHGFELTQVQNDDGTVQISYTLPQDAENVFVGLWNKFAFHVRTLVSEKMQLRGKQTIIWDGKDDQGNPVGPGVFICRMCTAGDKGASQFIELPSAI
jgi:flagellar hook assembly protein FlgD